MVSSEDFREYMNSIKQKVFLMEFQSLISANKIASFTPSLRDGLNLDRNPKILFIPSE